MAGTLLAHLVDRFRRPREVILTSALCHVLCQSDEVWEAFLSVAKSSQGTLPVDMELLEQDAQADGSRPDLVGTADGATVLLVELKLGAGLTSRQPVQYIARLALDRYAVLLFIAPRYRISRLTEAIVNQLSGQFPAMTAPRALRSGAVAVTVDAKRHIVIAEWGAVIQRMRDNAARAQNSRGVVSDIDQLEGLFKEMDDFTPFKEADLSYRVPAMLYQLYNYAVIGLRDRALETRQSRLHGHFSYRRSRNPGNSWGFDLKMDDTPVRLQLNFDMWYRYGLSPIWFTVHPIDAGHAARLRAGLERGGLQPQRDVDDPSAIAVPLLVPPNRSDQETLDDLERQLLGVMRRSARVSPAHLATTKTSSHESQPIRRTSR